MRASEETFQEGFNCAQAVLSEYGPALGMDREDCLRLAAGFGGGMGHMADTCGAVTGAYMVIGLRYGYADAGDRKAKDLTNEKVREFAKEFSMRNGTTVCRELLGCDVSTREGRKTARSEEMFKNKCPKFVKDASEILEELIKPEAPR